MRLLATPRQDQQRVSRTVFRHISQKILADATSINEDLCSIFIHLKTAAVVKVVLLKNWHTEREDIFRITRRTTNVKPLWLNEENNAVRRKIDRTRDNF
jgi:hypothetical protein